MTMYDILLNHLFKLLSVMHIIFLVLSECKTFESHLIMILTVMICFANVHQSQVCHLAGCLHTLLLSSCKVCFFFRFVVQNVSSSGTLSLCGSVLES